MMDGLLAHIQKLAAPSDQDLTQLASYFTKQHCKKKEILHPAGQRCRHHYFVQKGCLRMYYITDKGTEQTIQFALENWWLSDYLAFNQQRTSDFYIQAVEDSTVFRIDFPSQERMIDDIPKMERYFRLVYQRAYGASQVRMKYLSDLSKEEAYVHFSTSFPDFARRVPQQMLASYLQMTPEYLSEIKRKINE